MKKYEQLVWKYLKGNKKRTFATMLGVAFGALLIFAVFNITFCQLDKGLKNAEQMYKFDVVFYDLSEEQAEAIENYPGVEASYGGAFHPKTFEHTEIVMVDDFNNNPYGIQLQEGEYPKNSNEILVNVTAATEYEVGDTIYFAPGIWEQIAEPMEFVVTGTFKYEGDFQDISIYEYSYVSYLGLLRQDSYQQLKDTNAVFVKYKTQYRMAGLSEDIAEAVGAEYVLNDSIALYYNQTSDGSIQAVIAAVILFIVVMIALMAVAVIKNTLRISVAERMRDYGVLRCAGASLKQLKKMVVYESLAIGFLSGLAGIVLSYVGLLIFSHMSEKYDFTHFFLLAFGATILVILITMLLATIDPCKILAKLTPVEAVRNQVKVGKNETYKVRKARLITKVFGIEGAYAYKNAMRSPKQFITKVLALTIGIILFICTETICETYMHIVMEDTEIDKYYNVVVDRTELEWMYYDNGGVSDEAYAEFDKNVGLAELEFRKLDDVGKTVGAIAMAGYGDYVEGYNLKATDITTLYTDAYKETYRYNEDLHGLTYPAEDSAVSEMNLYAVAAMSRTPSIYGYDARLLTQLEDVLLDGTCDPEELGEDGIILCNMEQVSIYDPDTASDKAVAVEVFNHKIGDQVTIVSAPYEEYQKRMQDKETEYINDYSYLVEEYGLQDVDGAEYVRMTYKNLIQLEVLQDLYEEGYYKTYTIKGIVSDDTLIEGGYNYTAHYIASMDQMQEMFPGNIDIMYLGMHVDGYDANVVNILEKYELPSEYLWSIELYRDFDNVRKSCNAILLIILIFMTINIYNTTSSSMIFRKKEFALLRCVGMSKKKLTYMILLEGLLALLIAIVIGGIISAVSCYGIYRYFLAMMQELTASYAPLGRIFGALILLFVIMFLASWIPLQSIKKEIAPSLAEIDE